MKDSCSSISRLLGKYFDQEATDKQRLLVENHLQDCTACQDALKSMEELRALIKSPVEEALQKEDFPWVWQNIERQIRLQEKQPWWESIRSWLDISPLFKRKVWIPAVATAVVLFFITTQIIFRNTSSYPDASVVEYVESETNNVMVYDLEKARVTVIWLFEKPGEEAFPS